MLFTKFFKSWSVVFCAVCAILAVVGPFGTRPALAQAPAEIVELAKALKNSPDLIFEYVYNNIETLPQYGSLRKGRSGRCSTARGHPSTKPS